MSRSGGPAALLSSCVLGHLAEQWSQREQQRNAGKLVAELGLSDMCGGVEYH